jgi:hypothetical protein
MSSTLSLEVSGDPEKLRTRRIARLCAGKGIKNRIQGTVVSGDPAQLVTITGSPARARRSLCRRKARTQGTVVCPQDFFGFLGPILGTDAAEIAAIRRPVATCDPWRAE